MIARLGASLLYNLFLMKMKFNGEELETTSLNISDFLVEKNINVIGIAIALNNKVVSRKLWNEVALKVGDDLIVISAAYGG